MSWPAARKATLDRDEFTCQRCLRPAADVHHRLPRQSGGSSDPERNYGLANLVSLCRKCHAHVHAHPAESYEQGWLIRSGDDPADILVEHPEVIAF